MKTGKYWAVCFIASAALLAGSAALAANERQSPDFRMVVQNRHAGIVSSVAFTPDGKYILSGSWDGAIKLWNREGILLRTFDGQVSAVSSLTASPDGKKVVSGSSDGTLKIWDLDGNLVNNYAENLYWKFMAYFEIPFSGTRVAVSPDGRYIASGGVDQTVKLWSAEGKLLRLFKEHAGSVNSVAFSPDGKHIASGSYDKTLKLWDLDGRLVRTMSHGGEVNSVAFSPDGKRIASGSGDNTIKLWDLAGKLLVTFKGHTGPVKSIAFSPDGKYLVSGAWDGLRSIKLWNMEGRLLRSFGFLMVESVAFSPDGKHIVSGGFSSMIQLWDTEGRLIAPLDFSIPGPAWDLKFSPDGKYLVSYRPGKLEFLAVDGKLVRSIELLDQSPVLPVVLSQGGKYFVSGSTNNTLSICDMEGRAVGTIEEKPGDVASISFSPDSRYLVIGSTDGAVRLRNLDGGLAGTFKGHSDRVASVAVSPDGKYLLSGSRETIALWSLEGRRVGVLKAPSGFIASAAFSPDGRYVVSGNDDGVISIWHAELGPQKDLKGRLKEMLPDVLTSGRTPKRSFKGHLLKIRALSFSPDGKYIVSGSRDRTIKLWDMEGNPVKTFQTGSGQINGLDFAPGGRYIAAGLGDGTIKLWDVDTGENYAVAAADNEWIMYTPDGYFDASPRGGRLAAMVKGREAFGADQFAVRNNRPDLILGRMGLGMPEQIGYYSMLHRKRLEKLGFTEAALGPELHVPEAAITGMKRAGKFADVAFSLSDGMLPLKRYNIYVNDVPLFGSSGREIDGGSFQGTEKIELTAGRNKIEVSAMNSAGAESYRAMTFADYDAMEKGILHCLTISSASDGSCDRGAPHGALYYLAFGASRYKDPKLSLDYADKDVKDLEAIFLKMRPRFSAIHVKTFVNEDVTAENIKEAKYFLNEAGTDDTVVLAVAGHGGYSGGGAPTYYYVAYGTDIDDLAGTGVDFDTIEDLLDGIKPRKKLFLLDTCESGELDEGVYGDYLARAGARGLTPRTHRKPMKARGKGAARAYMYEKDRFIYNDLARRTGAVVFSSSKGGELSYESPAIRNGFFTKEIIAALTGKAADRNGDGKLDTGELRDFVSAAVVKNTGGLQHPTIDRDNLYEKIELPLVHDISSETR